MLKKILLSIIAIIHTLLLVYLFFNVILPMLNVALADILSLTIGAIILLVLFFGFGIPLLLFEIALILWWDWWD